MGESGTGKPPRRRRTHETVAERLSRSDCRAKPQSRLRAGCKRSGAGAPRGVPSVAGEAAESVRAPRRRRAGRGRRARWSERSPLWPAAAAARSRRRAARPAAAATGPAAARGGAASERRGRPRAAQAQAAGAAARRGFGRAEPLLRRAPDEGVERARRRGRRPAIADDPVGDPRLVARRARGARQPFARRPFGAVGGLDVGHQQTGSRGRPARRVGRDQRADRRARGGEVARLERGAAERQPAFRVMRRDARQRLGARESGRRPNRRA